MFLAATFTIAKIWKQLKRLLTDEWIKKMWYIYTMGYDSAIKKRMKFSFATMWMDLESIMLLSLKCRIWKNLKMHVYNKTAKDPQI